MAAMTGCSVVGIDHHVIAPCGLRLSTENLTRNIAEVAERRRIARESRSSSLREIEGDQPLRATARVSSDRRSHRQGRNTLSLCFART
jgi:hypothetical protein